MRKRLQPLLFLFLLAAAPATQPIIEDRFDGRVGEGWSWLREDNQAWGIQPDGLHLRVSSGSLWDKTNSAKNVLLRELPPEPTDIAAEVTVTSHPQDPAEQATLMYYVDEDNYVKLCKEQMMGKQNVVLAREEAGKGKFIAGSPTKEKTIHLRLTRRGNEISGAFSGDGAAWLQVGKCEIPAGKAFKIGIVAHGANTGDAREATFKDFRVFKINP